MKRLLFVVLIAISLDAWPITPANKPPAQTPTNAASVDKPAVTATIAESPHVEPVSRDTSVVTPEAKASRDLPSKSEGENGHWWDYTTAISTAVLAVVTAILAGFTYALWNATRKLVQEDKSTSKQELRAYLSVIPIAYDAAGSIYPPAVRFEVRNFGQTPAKSICIKSKFYVAEYPNETAEYFVSTLSGGVLFANEKLNSSIFFAGDYQTTVFQDALGNIGKDSLLFDCHVTYVDVFGESHTTRHISSTRIDHQHGRNATVAFTFAPTGNEIT